jgi:hypothetical protein
VEDVAVIRIACIVACSALSGEADPICCQEQLLSFNLLEETEGVKGRYTYGRVFVVRLASRQNDAGDDQ